MPAILAALGATPSGARAERVRQSPHFRDGSFRNSTPTRTMVGGESRPSVREFLTGGERRRPSAPVPLVTGEPATSADGLHLTWYGHATVLVEIEGARVLLDPVWSDRCSPTPGIGPKRLHPMPVALADLPRLDAIVISHDHYDHLDMPTVQALTRSQQAPFLVPLGVGAHLERWGVPDHRIIELDWEESADVAGLTLTATEARHFSGRTLRRNGTLWSSWVIAGEQRRVFYTGDSGYFDGYAAIGERHGPFDATLMQIGAYDKGWPEIHMFPEEAVAAHLDLRGDLLIPVHWATFNLALHPWAEPVDRLWAEAKARDVNLAVPRPGERVDATAPPALDPWWQALV
ncbi:MULTISPECIES: MBL fold metallo-hydrolase [Catellatospora]|uniref:Zn-dependent hydrolase n=1 Tax=Catellatospora citrea TaxID=53366 RepID=A0A8J3KIY6_9ACTN|nr:MULTISPECIES: MBL fold metallo-hydrolase [Catellatospora]RKE12316.1 L-ascorbate metabolism protein UlaG (beta-lactamase superfamily) [Catellatospora citrea]GIG00823.1 Zn-dependent hydrolase [Catellatospora citrea]